MLQTKIWLAYITSLKVMLTRAFKTLRGTIQTLLIYLLTIFWIWLKRNILQNYHLIFHWAGVVYLALVSEPHLPFRSVNKSAMMRYVETEMLERKVESQKVSWNPWVPSWTVRKYISCSVSMSGHVKHTFSGNSQA